MTDLSYTNIAHSSLILDCRDLVRQIPSVKINHYFREVNQCVLIADWLAKIEITLPHGFCNLRYASHGDQFAFTL